MRLLFITLLFSILSLEGALSQDGLDASGYLRRAEKNLKANEYAEALDNYEAAFRLDREVAARHYYNAAVMAEKAGILEKFYILMESALQVDGDWYVRDFRERGILQALDSDPRGQIIADSLESRPSRIDKDFDRELRAELYAIMDADQNVRREYSAAVNEGDKTRIDSLVTAMVKTDSVNQLRIVELLDTKGWPGREMVGDAGIVYFLVLQHATLELQQKYLPQVRTAAARGDIQMSNLALFEDRMALREGRMQTYGTQVLKGPDGSHTLAPLEDPENVNKRRDSVGLGPIEEYLRNWNIEWPPVQD